MVFICLQINEVEVHKNKAAFVFLVNICEDVAVSLGECLLDECDWLLGLVEGIHLQQKGLIEEKEGAGGTVGRCAFSSICKQPVFLPSFLPISLCPTVKALWCDKTLAQQRW